MSIPIAPPESPFDERPSPKDKKGSTASSSSTSEAAPSSTVASAKPMPIELPLTSFASTPHNVACIAFVLGALWSTGLVLALPNLPGWFAWSTAAVAKLPEQSWWTTLMSNPQLGTYMASVAFFHLMEFVVTSMYNPGKLSVASYLLDNGAQYHIAHACGLIEAVLEERYFPAAYRQWKHSGAVYIAGFALIAAGQILRSFAMISASSNFSHLLAYTKRPDHQLVKEGIYSWSRHPSYAGFYWWAVGTQVMLGNPICALLFIAILQYFFAGRIRIEEQYLVKFFGKEYEQYRATVPTRILFIP
ncbi:hypothetical protein JCM10207_002631 [Rhodosporidiobolus poonsookiae]